MKIKKASFRGRLKTSTLFLLVLLVFAWMPIMSFADRSLSMQTLDIRAEIMPDASMKVVESITVDFSGQWNGFYVQIPEGNTPIVDVTVSENGQSYTFNPGTEYGPPGTFLIKQEGADKLIDWSIDAYDMARTFELSYTVVNAVKIHSDVAELYRKFVGDSNGNSIENVKVRLILPSGAEQYVQGEDIRIWGHGPLNGEVAFDGDNAVVWNAGNLSPYTFVEGRVVMPTALFSGAPAQAYDTNIALGSILEEEQGNADRANKQRQGAKVELGAAAGVLLASIAGLVYIWSRFGRRYKASFDGDYYRDLPASYSPAELSVLWNYKKMKPSDITATIMDLARRKFIYLQEDVVEVKKIIGTKEVTTYKLTFMEHPEPTSLKNPQEATLRFHEEKLLNYLKINIGANKGYIHLTDIEYHSKKHAEEFFKFWTNWTEYVEIAVKDYNFFDKDTSMRRATGIAGLLMIVGGSFFIMTSFAIGLAITISGFLITIVPQTFKRRSPKGEEDYAKWKAFKKFLEDFSQMQTHEIPSLIIWEHYLVYAVTLGVAKEVIKQLELVFPNMTDGNYRFGQGWMHYSAYNNFTTFNNSFDMIGKSIDKAVSSAQTAMSQSSSGSGGGGGFSSGGGGGGGGGSYGGR